MGWVNTISNGLLAICAFTVAGSLFYLAFKHRVKNLSSAFLSLGFVFFVGAIERVEHLTDMSTEWWKVLTTVLVAVAVLVFTLAVLRCIRVALPMFTRMAVLERKLERRVGVLQGRDDESDIEAVQTLTEVRDMMRSVLNEGRT